MKVLIIGGTGILSKAVVDECVLHGYTVTMINRGSRKLFINKNVELLVSDVHDAEKIKSLLNGKKFDAVIDFLCFTTSDIDYSVGLFGMYAKQFIFISSAQVYNTSISEVLSETSDLVQPLWDYSINKVESERRLSKLCKEKGIEFTIIRPGVNYDNTRIPYGMYPPMGQHWTICSRIINDKPIITWNNGNNKLNLTRVEDFATGTVGLVGNEKAYGEAFNVVGDNVYTWKEVLNTLGTYLNKDVKTIDVPVEFYANELENEKDKQMLRGGRALDLVCSNEKLKKICPGLTTKYDLNAGIKKTLDFYKEHNYLNGFNYSYDGECDRIIRKYEKIMHLTPSKTGFVRYSDHVSIKDRILYTLSYYRDSPIIKLVNGLIKMIR